jgi:hypothetical protein
MRSEQRLEEGRSEPGDYQGGMSQVEESAREETRRDWRDTSQKDDGLWP